MADSSMLVESIRDGNVMTFLQLAHYSNNDINALSRDGVTPLIEAIRRNQFTLFTAVMNTRGVDVNKPDKDGKTPLQYAREAHGKAMEMELIRRGAR